MIKGKAALIVIDVQKDTLDKSLQFYDEKNVEIVAKTRKLIDACRDANIPVIYAQEIHRSSGIDFGRELDGSEKPHSLDNHPNTDIADEVDIRPDDPLIQKRRYSCFLYTDLEIVLNGLEVFPNDTLIICGFFTDVCVHYTFMDAHQLDYRIKVVEDCCGGSSVYAHKGAMKAMKYLQHNAPVSLEEIVKDIAEYIKSN